MTPQLILTPLNNPGPHFRHVSSRYMRSPPLDLSYRVVSGFSVFIWFFGNVLAFGCNRSCYDYDYYAPHVTTTRSNHVTTSRVSVTFFGFVSGFTPYRSAFYFFTFSFFKPHPCFFFLWIPDSVLGAVVLWNCLEDILEFWIDCFKITFRVWV